MLQDEAIRTIERAMVHIRRSQARRTIARTAEAAAGADAGAFAVVDALADAEERALGPVSVGRLATLLGADQSRASRMASAAVTAGLACREAAQHDGRRSLLVLTAAGRRAVNEARRARAALFAAALTTWTDDERTTFAVLLDRFVTTLTEAIEDH